MHRLCLHQLWTTCEPVAPELSEHIPCRAGTRFGVYWEGMHAKAEKQDLHERLLVQICMEYTTMLNDQLPQVLHGWFSPAIDLHIRLAFLPH